MITMNCPSCGAEGRVPKDKVNTRLLCKKCLKSFHLTPEGRVVAGSPHESGKALHLIPEAHVLDHVEEEVDHWVERLRRSVPWIAAAVLVLGLVVGGLAVLRASRPLPFDEQAARIAQALIRNDLKTLRGLSVSGTDDAVAEWAEAVRPEFQEHTESSQTAAPRVEVVRSHQDVGPGLREAFASIHTDQAVGRMGFAVPDVSTSMKSTGAVEVPMILAGDDRWGWRLDGGRTLEAFRKSRPGTLAGTAQP
ncbi:hypothetical protein [Planctomyces sp. SH-PL62]|uniref:hypothetical protein n=1 Tax=Planctomyces sp. SH-PL62 TaxID=1636152 RepID=UPI00078B796A|nr:hypothetical protein [Planctomyces sp. SH-PL62]AMV39388.1 hypothetical protein VT85_18265 [Planctomyces sp. SH-PL62]